MVEGLVHIIDYEQQELDEQADEVMLRYLEDEVMVQLILDDEDDEVLLIREEVQLVSAEQVEVV